MNFEKFSFFPTLCFRSFSLPPSLSLFLSRLGGRCVAVCSYVLSALSLSLVCVQKENAFLNNAEKKRHKSHWANNVVGQFFTTTRGKNIIANVVNLRTSTFYELHLNSTNYSRKCNIFIIFPNYIRKDIFCTTVKY